MKKYLEYVAEKAREHFKNFGFDEDTIYLLINQGIADLKNNLTRLEEFVKNPPQNLNELADTAHTVKGLLANLGLEEEGMKFKQIQLMVLEGKPREEVLGALKKLLEPITKSSIPSSQKEKESEENGEEKNEEEESFIKKDFQLVKNFLEFKNFRIEPTLIIVFFPEKFEVSAFLKQLKERYPKARIIGCSSESITTSELPFVLDEEAVIVGLNLDPNHFDVVEISFELEEEDFNQKLSQLKSRFSKCQYILLPALSFNSVSNDEKGLKRLNKIINELPYVFGGWAGRNSFAKEPFYIFDGKLKNNGAVVLVLDAERYFVKHFVFHGWLPVERVFHITKASGTEIFEIDEEPALELLKKYGGKYSKEVGNDLPIPIWTLLMIDREKNNYLPLIAIKAIDEEKKSIRTFLPVKKERFFFAIPDPWMIEKLTKNFSQYIEKEIMQERGELLCAFLFSCTGRKGFYRETIILECRELSFLAKYDYAGFFTWGEIAPPPGDEKSIFHNLTITFVTLFERKI